MYIQKFSAISDARLQRESQLAGLIFYNITANDNLSPYGNLVRHFRSDIIEFAMSCLFARIASQ